MLSAGCSLLKSLVSPKKLLIVSPNTMRTSRFLVWNRSSVISLTVFLGPGQEPVPIATSFDAVEKAFAVQAGREVRVIVTPDKISDDELPKLVHDIGEQIQREVMVPGAVKITAIRESRYSDSFLTSGS